MASRRLTISSLLCDDDAADPPLAGPSSAPPIPPLRDPAAEPYAYRNHPPGAEDASLYAHDVHPFAVVSPSHQRSATRRRRHTPPPVPQLEQSPSIPPSISRRSFREIAFDDYRDTSSPTTRPIGDGSDHHRSRRSSPQVDLTRHSQSRTAIESLVHRQQPYSPSHSLYHPSPEPAVALRTYPESFYVPQLEPEPPKLYPRSVSHSPVAPFPSSHQRASQSPLLASTSSTFYSQSYVSPRSPHPSRSPVQTLSPPVPVAYPTSPQASYARRSPLADTYYSPTLAKPTLSALLTQSPSAGRASASSLPHILNSPVMSRGKGMDYSAGPNSAVTPGMEALEALAELATQERKRVVGVKDENPEVTIITTKASVSPVQSPVISRVDIVAHDTGSVVAHPHSLATTRSLSTRSSPVVERGPSLRASPTVERTEDSTCASPAHDREEPSSAATLVDPSTPNPVTLDIPAHTSIDGRSDGQASPVNPPRDIPSDHREATAITPSPTLPHQESPTGSPLSTSNVNAVSSYIPVDGEPPAKRRRSSPPASPPVVPSDGQPSIPPISMSTRVSPKVESQELQSILPPQPSSAGTPRRQSPPPPAIEQAPPPCQKAASIKASSPVPRQDEEKALVTPVPTKPPSVPKQKKTTKSKEKADSKRRVVKSNETETMPTLHNERPPPAGSPLEEDAYEWLMEEYGGRTSPSSHPHGHSGRDKSGTSSATARHTQKHDGDNATAHQTASRGKASQSAKHKPKDTHARARSPTPLAMLEQELELEAELLGDDEETLKTSSKARDMDVDSELDFAVNEAYTRREDAADMDVDAELLSLLDDQPHSSSKQPHTSVASHDHPPRRSTSPAKGSVSGVHDDVVDRSSMPPPPTSGGQGAKKKGDAPATAAKKKEAAEKPPAKKTPAPTKPKPKPKAKPKPSKKDDSVTPTPVASTSTSTLNVPTLAGSARSKKSSPLASGSANGFTAKRAVSIGGGASRSRSTSLMPGTDADKNPAEEENAGAAADDRLYCICKTSYDEDRVMIACDRCDEWYHTSCVDMPDLEVDLVDQFICPVCIAKHPELPLKTTYKTRCWAGLQAPNPSSPDACHKPSRGAFSKYCSDECGVKHMKSQIQPWPGDKRSLWEAVKHAERREGVVYRVVEDSRTNGVSKDGIRGPSEPRLELVTPTKTQAQRELERLQAQLVKVEDKREILSSQQEVLQWRERVLELAATRSERVQECGWDQRLCFGDEEVLEFGADVPDTYEEDERRGTPDEMQVDGISGEWWCRGKKKCDRHAGWQKLRKNEMELERELQEAQLERLTTQEREIRKKMEGVSELAARKPAITGPLQPYNGDISPKDILKQTNGVAKKGKKRKAEN